MNVSGVSAVAAVAPRPGERVPGPAAAAGRTVVDLAAVTQAIASVKEVLKPVAGSLEFNVDQSSGRTIVRVVDQETHQLIRQIPSEEMVELSRVLERLEGLLLNKRA